MKNGAYLLIGGDVTITPSNESLFTKGRTEELFDSGISDLVEHAELCAINCEMAITEEDTPKAKRGGHFKASPMSLAGLRKMGVDLCFLANNHTIDYGDKGLIDTISELEKSNINTVGAGKSKETIQKTYYYTTEKGIIGIYNIADKEFNEPTGNSPGVNTYDPLTSFDEIRETKETCDYLIVVFHAGVERYRYPSPNLRRICRKMVECGANVVTCQHSHCIGCKEEYNNGTIIYGQGNFLLDDGEIECYKTGLLLTINLCDFSIHYHFVVKNGVGVRCASDNEFAAIMRDFEERSTEIKEENTIDTLFDEYIATMKNVYLSALLCNNTLYRYANKITKGKLYKSMFSSMNRLRLINMLEAEAHRECLVRSIRNNEDIDN